MKKLFLTNTLFLVLILAMPLLVQAEEELRVITTENLAKGLEEKSLDVVDCNSDWIYKFNHIPNAIHMDVLNPNAKILPKDKTRQLVFYCKNPRCMASHRGAKFAINQGYTQVWVYPEGIDGWVKAGKKVEGGS